MVGSGDGAGDGSLLLVVGETFASKVCGTSLRDLEDDGRFDVPAISCQFPLDVTSQIFYLAASRAALAVEDEVTF